MKTSFLHVFGALCILTLIRVVSLIVFTFSRVPESSSQPILFVPQLFAAVTLYFAILSERNPERIGLAVASVAWLALATTLLTVESRSTPWILAAVLQTLDSAIVLIAALLGALAGRYLTKSLSQRRDQT